MELLIYKINRDDFRSELFLPQCFESQESKSSGTQGLNIYHFSLKHSRGKHKPIRTVSCSGKLKVGAVGCVAVSSVSSHMEDVDGGGSEACDYHAEGFGPH